MVISDFYVILFLYEVIFYHQTQMYPTIRKVDFYKLVPHESATYHFLLVILNLIELMLQLCVRLFYFINISWIIDLIYKLAVN